MREGFSGTKQEWLESLKGDKGADGKDGANAALTAEEVKKLYEQACDSGYEGTYLQFLKEYLGGNDCSDMVNEAVFSAVRVVSSFTVSTGYYGNAQKSTSNGAGVIYSVDKASGNAYVITNYHVVYYKNANTDDNISDDISLYLYGGEYDGGKISATYVGGSMTYDIAVLKVENSDVIKNSAARAVTFANTDAVKVGLPVVAIGNPESKGISATYGIVSKDSEYVTMTAADDVTSVQYRCLRIDCAINHGNSGGGLFAADGSLLGIVNAKIESDGVDDIGYAIPANIAKRVAENIIWNAESGNSAKKCVSKALMGISTYAQSSCAVYDNELNAARIVETVVVNSVISGSIADKAGVKKGDVIKSISFGGKTFEISRVFHVVDSMFEVRPNDQVVLTVERSGVQKTITMSVSAKDFVDIE